MRTLAEQVVVRSGRKVVGGGYPRSGLGQMLYEDLVAVALAVALGYLVAVALRTFTG